MAAFLKKEKINKVFAVAKIAKRLLGFLWKIDKPLFASSLTVAVIPAFLPFANAYIYKLVIDMIVGALNHSRFNFQLLYFLMALRLITFIIQELFFSLQDYIDLMVWTKLPVALYRVVLLKLSELDLRYFEDSNFKDMLQRVKESYTWRPLNMISAIFYTFQSLTALLLAVVIISTLNIFLGFFIILIALPVFLNQTKYAKTIWGLWEGHSPYRKKFWYISDLIQNGQSVKEMKIFQTARTFIGELDKIQKKFVSENTRIGKKRFSTTLLFDIGGVFVYFAIELFIILSTIAGRITIGSLTYFTFVVGNFQAAVNGLFRNLSQTYNQTLYVEDIFKVLDAKPLVHSPKKAVKVNIHKSPTIEFRNVSFSYPGSKKEVLKNFSLTIKSGEKIALVGENGVGKTTVVKLLARFYDVTSGEILVNGVNLNRLNLTAWHKSLGVIFQDFIKYEYSLRENIYFGKTFEKENFKDILKAAKKSGASKVAESLEKGYEQVLGKTFEGGADLSVGEWQKVALARAFFRNAPVLILDEPTASIDAKAENEIFEKVENLGKDKTVIIISHRFSTVRSADEICVIDKGRIVEMGSHNRLMELKGRYEKLFNLQAKRYR
jgi:ATP-binding cassette subfamily B protein